MTQNISQADPKTLSTKEILAEIDGFKALAVNVLKRWSALLAELKRRRVPNIMFNHPVLKFWESINDCTLDPQAAVLLADRRDGKMIRAVLSLPPAQQVEVAKGEPVPVAVMADTGEIRRDEIPIHCMDLTTLKRAFGPQGIRPVHEQAEMIRAEGRVERRGAVTVLRDENAVKIGNQKFRFPEEFESAARALGYEIVLTR